MLLTDWRNGSFAILLALGILLVGHALALRNKTPAAEAVRPAKGTSRRAVSTSELGPLRASSRARRYWRARRLPSR
jgi:hypothetical protein